MVKSRRTGLDYPEPTIPTQFELQQCFEAAQVGDMVVLYIQYEDDLYSIYQQFVRVRSEDGQTLFITHVAQGFAIANGKAQDKEGKVIEHWQLLPYTEEIQLAVRHIQLVERVSHLLHKGIPLLAAMRDEQLTAVEAIFEQLESQSPIYPLVNAKEARILEAERQKVLQENDAGSHNL